ncbi:dihydroxyacetone kinase subunit M [Escherichia coli]|nr:dihydroxyacetone kinase subunit M [Escherichia coli]
MVNLVIVSHSSRLGEGVGELARQMLMSDSCKIAIAAGIDDPQKSHWYRCRQSDGGHRICC